MDGGEDNADSRLLAERTARIGAYVIGRSMFDFGEEPWGEEPPFHAPVVVVTHRERVPLDRVGTTFTFETGLEPAVKPALAAANGRDVQISGGASIARQALAAELRRRTRPPHHTPSSSGRVSGCSTARDRNDRSQAAEHDSLRERHPPCLARNAQVGRGSARAEQPGSGCADAGDGVLVEDVRAGGGVVGVLPHALLESGGAEGVA